MNRKILTIILAVVLIASFFLPMGAGGSTSAFDLVQGPSFGNSIEAILMKYLWLAIPLSGVMLLIGALNKETYFLGRGIWAMLPLLALLMLLIGIPMMQGAAIGDVFKLITKMYGIGVWVALGASLVLAIYWPRR
ncbi:MAG TPA: hypothetical protein PLO99_00340 [Chitinophagaceae bacterium]|jgi:hypothetical protein|nr:hypothetical protein [Chitinophagaceae bacterium]HRG91324.1 hypothetical protein [Chitinophagaceae bacterium]